MFSFFKSLFDDNKKIIAKYQLTVDQINKLEPEMENLTNEELSGKTAQFKLRLSKGETIDDILIESFAVVREAAKRILSMRMFDVQLMAALAFHNGQVAEQKTGEGKTLSAVPALYLNSLTGNGCHLVTVNDYLARRDAGWMGQVFDFLNISIGVIFSGKGDQPALIYDREYNDSEQNDSRLKHLKPIDRKTAYNADITYGTNNEFGFDYLRDNMVQSVEEMVQRGHNFAIVDEVDSILIDEARTPLIISAPDSEPTDKYLQFSQLASELSSDTDYTIDEKVKSAALTEHGITKIEKKLKIDNLYEKDFEIIHHIENALKARSLYLKDKDYVIKDDQIIIVDEFTGRLMYGRRWSEGLHQAVEAKEAVKIQQESKTLATISFQNYFRMYEKLAGMTGTAATESEEFNFIYKLQVIVIPTNQSVCRIDNPDVVYKNARAKYAAIAAEIETLHQKGQPILVGTTSITKNDIVSSLLKKKRIPHQVLNAKNHEGEALVIADAGKVGGVTIATNIAGRGVDIVLGGAKPDKSAFKTQKAYEKEMENWQKEHNKVVELGGLAVIGTERHESRRIDNQLRGRSGRQGDPGMSRFYVALDDEIMRLFGGEQVARIMTMFNLPENIPLEHPMVSKVIEQSQVKVEGFHFDSRKHVVEYDDVMNKQREIIYKRRANVLHLVHQLEQAKKNKEEFSGDSLKEKIFNNINSHIENLVNTYAPESFSQIEYEKIIRDFCEIVPFDLNSQKRLEKDLAHEKNPQAMIKFLQKVFTDVYEKREKEMGENVIRQIETFVTLRTIDKLWMDHLDDLDNLRDGIGLRGYGQKDPLVEYKKEAFDMFAQLLNNIDYEISRQILRIKIMAAPTMPRHTIEQHPQAQNSANSENNSNIIKTVKRNGEDKKLGRNDPCWCGSGKKWKKCHYPEVG